MSFASVANNPIGQTNQFLLPSTYVKGYVPGVFPANPTQLLSFTMPSGTYVILGNIQANSNTRQFDLSFKTHFHMLVDGMPMFDSHIFSVADSQGAFCQLGGLLIVKSGGSVLTVTTDQLYYVSSGGGAITFASVLNAGIQVQMNVSYTRIVQ